MGFHRPRRCRCRCTERLTRSTPRLRPRLHYENKASYIGRREQAIIVGILLCSILRIRLRISRVGGGARGHDPGSQLCRYCTKNDIKASRFEDSASVGRNNGSHRPRKHHTSMIAPLSSSCIAAHNHRMMRDGKWRNSTSSSTISVLGGTDGDPAFIVYDWYLVRIQEPSVYFLTP